MTVMNESIRKISPDDIADKKTLLNTPIRELDLSLEDTPYQPYLNRLHQELAAKGIAMRPHWYLGEEWFCSDKTQGISVPFYLCHPALIELEREYMDEVEGESKEEFMKLMRHECGHALDNAYNLNKDSEITSPECIKFTEDEETAQLYEERIALFGDHHAKAYPAFYEPKVYSKNFVSHLGDHYAQAHPVEDVAETFAV
jgi:hypothetical protein